MEPRKRSHSSKTRTVGYLPRKNGSLPHGEEEEEEEERSVVPFWVLTLGCKIPSLFFCLPASPLTSTHPVFIFCLSSPLPLSPTLLFCVMVLLRDTADNSHWKKKKLQEQTEAMGREVDTVCFRFLMTEVQLVGDYMTVILSYVYYM